MTRGQRVVVLVYLIVQLGVPLAALRRGTPWFGWRMFSQITLPPTVLVKLSATSAFDTLRLADHLGFPRGDLQFGAALAGEVCRVVPGAVQVRVTPAGGGSWTDTPC
ncbi:MAG: hypothetical protein ACREMX_04790 [Gemmatimonadales bacterium]